MDGEINVREDRKRERAEPLERQIRIGSRFCPVGASAVLAIRRVASEFGDQVIVKEVPASMETLSRYGVADGIFINGQLKFFGPVGENQVREAIQKELGGSERESQR